jgi:hypothetical protein
VDPQCFQVADAPAPREVRSIKWPEVRKGIITWPRVYEDGHGRPWIMVAAGCVGQRHALHVVRGDWKPPPAREECQVSGPDYKTGQALITLGPPKQTADDLSKFVAIPARVGAARGYAAVKRTDRRRQAPFLTNG